MALAKKGVPGPLDRADKDAQKDRDRGRGRPDSDKYHKPDKGITVPKKGGGRNDKVDYTPDY